MEKELLEILACPKCGGSISLNNKKDKLLCYDCKMIFEIKDGVPIMMINDQRAIK